MPAKTTPAVATTVDVSGSTVSLATSSLPEAATTTLQVCPRTVSGTIPAAASTLTVLPGVSGGTSSISLSSFVFNSGTSCFTATVTGVTSGTAINLGATLTGTSLTANVPVTGSSIQVLAPRLRFTGNSDVATAVASRIVTDVMASWTFTGECDVELGNVTIRGEAIDTPTTTSCSSAGGGTFSLLVNYSGASPKFSTHSYTPFALPQVIAKQGANWAMTRIYKIPTTATILYVATAAQLQAISINGFGIDYTRAIILTSDIDMSTLGATNNFTRLATGAGAATRFYSSIFGDGHTIANLNMTSGASGNATYASLLGYVGGGAFTDIHFTNVVIGSNQNYVGTLAGYLRSAVAARISVSGSVTSSGAIVGGVAGYGWDPQIRESWFAGSVTGMEQIGGIIGHLWDTYVSDSWTSGTVTATGVNGAAGGVVGVLNVASESAEIINCHSSASVSGKADVGGLIGQIPSTGSTSNPRNSFATGSVTMTNSPATGLEFAGPAVGINGQYAFSTYLQNSTVTLTNLFSLNTATCSTCYADSLTHSTTKTWYELNTFAEANWDLIEKWKAATNKNAGSPTLRYNP